MTNKKVTNRAVIELTLGAHLNIPKSAAKLIWKSRRHTQKYFGSQDFEPHITIHLTCLNKSGYHQLVSRLRRVNFRAIKMSFLALKLSPLPDGRIFISLPVRKTLALTGLHRRVVLATQPLRHGRLRAKDVKRLATGYYSPAAARCTRQYGYQFVMARYNPHITIGTIAKGGQKTLILRKIINDLKPLYQHPWVIDELVVGLYNYHQPQDRYVGQPVETVIRLPREGRE